MTSSSTAHSPQEVLAWLTSWPEDRVRSAGRIVALAKPQMLKGNTYTPLYAAPPAESERIAALEAEQRELENNVADLFAAARRHHARVQELEAVLEQARVALEPAKHGLAWYRDRHPEDADGSDDEAAALIDAALRAIEEVQHVR